MNIYETGIAFKEMSSNGVTIDQYRGQVLLIVNTASKCGFTPQFEALERIYQTYKDRGFVVLGFPCNQFADQDPGSNQEILEFCQLNYGVSFPMHERIAVNGENRHPLYQYLIENSPKRAGSDIKWNFEKFLISRDGVVLGRYLSTKRPESLTKAIELALD